MTPHAICRRASAAIAVFLGALALPAIGADAPAPSDQGALQELAAAYRARPSAERLEITHLSGGVSQSETITSVIRPPDDVRLEFGPYVVWLTDRFVRVIHQQDMKGFFEAPVDGASPLQTLESLFPPLPVPQLSLLYSQRTQAIELTPYCEGLTWSAPVEKVGAGGIERERRGESARVHAQLFTIDNRITRLLIRADDDQQIEITSTPLPGFDIDKAMESELGHRTQVASIADLQPRPGDSGVGSPLPPLLLAPSDIETPARAPTGPCAILFFDAINENLSIARDAVRIVRQKRPTVELWPTLVVDIIEPRLSFRIDESRVQFGPDPVYYTMSPITTVERFSDDGRSALVIVDDQSIVRAVIPLANLAQGKAPSAPDSDHQARVDALVEVILNALRPQPQVP